MVSVLSTGTRAICKLTVSLLYKLRQQEAIEMLAASASRRKQVLKSVNISAALIVRVWYSRSALCAQFGLINAASSTSSILYIDQKGDAEVWDIRASKCF